MHKTLFPYLGRMISRSNTYNSMYFVSVRAMQVLKGKIPRRERSNVRLLFHTATASSSSSSSPSQLRKLRYERYLDEDTDGLLIMYLHQYLLYGACIA